MTSNSVESTLFDGFATMIADAGLADYADSYTGIETCPVTSRSLFDSPGRGLAITVYKTASMPEPRLDRYAVQIRGRGVPDDDLDADELVGPVHDLLDNLTDRWFGTGDRAVHIEQCLFRFTAQMGTDATNRTERADTFDLDVTPPQTANRPA